MHRLFNWCNSFPPPLPAKNRFPTHFSCASLVFRLFDSSDPLPFLRAPNIARARDFCDVSRPRRVADLGDVWRAGRRRHPPLTPAANPVFPGSIQ
jgi:hypothetical protein